MPLPLRGNEESCRSANGGAGPQRPAVGVGQALGRHNLLRVPRRHYPTLTEQDNSAGMSRGDVEIMQNHGRFSQDEPCCGRNNLVTRCHHHVADTLSASRYTETPLKSAPYTPPNPDDAPNEDTRFSAVVRARTAERHSKAEHSTFMSDLMEGSLDAAAYTQLLTQYEYIYEALESVAHRFRQLDDELTRPFNQPGLDRLASIRHDLRQLRKPGDAMPPCLTSTNDYVERIRQTAASPERFLAHHYLRYLGDLSGGQAVAALMERHYGVSSEGLSMYRFEELPKPKIFKDQYRTLLDEAPMSEEQHQAFLDEAVLGFDLNARVFDDLAAHRERAGTTI